MQNSLLPLHALASTGRENVTMEKKNDRCKARLRIRFELRIWFVEAVPIKK